MLRCVTKSVTTLLTSTTHLRQKGRHLRKHLPATQHTHVTDHSRGERMYPQRAPIAEGEREYARSGHQSQKGREIYPQRAPIVRLSPDDYVCNIQMSSRLSIFDTGMKLGTFWVELLVFFTVGLQLWPLLSPCLAAPPPENSILEPAYFRTAKTRPSGGSCIKPLPYYATPPLESSTLISSRKYLRIPRVRVEPYFAALTRGDISSRDCP